DLATLTWPARLEFYRKDGTVYRVELTEKDGRHFARTEASMDDSAGKEKAAGGDKGQAALQLSLDTVGAFNRDHGEWVYEIDPSWMRVAQMKQADLLE
ncbi:MAG: hypothetical protein MUE76_02855, partial [Syntrophales bacterium]|nr:hypothetical protein [Syntrophales bacterium]